MAVGVAGAAASLALLVGPGPEPARSDALDLTVTSEIGCLGVDDLAAAILHEYPAAASAAVALEVHELDAQSVEFTITADEASAKRALAFDDEDCDARRASVAFAIAVALEFHVELGPAPADPFANPEPDTPPPQSAAPAPRPVVRDAPEPETWPLRSRRAMWTLGAGPVVAFGLIPNVLAGATIVPAVHWRRLAVRTPIHAAFAPPIPLAEGRMRVGVVAIEPELCGRVRIGRGVAAFCGGLEIGWVQARGLGFARPHRSFGPWAAPRVTVELTAPLGPRVAIAVAPFAAIPIVRPRFVVGTARRLAGPVLYGAAVTAIFALGPR